MNRVGAWVIGTRSVLKALLIALLEPTDTIRKFEESGDYFARLAMLENLKLTPIGNVWNYFCGINDAASDSRIIDEIISYERTVLLQFR